MYPKIQKSAILYKKGSGHGLLQRQNWKRRHVELTGTDLKYYDPSRYILKGSIDLTTCCLSDLKVMPAECMKTGHSESSKWRVAIDTPERRFVFAAETESEMLEWVDVLRLIFAANERYLIQRESKCESGDSNSFIFRYLERLGASQ